MRTSFAARETCGGGKVTSVWEARVELMAQAEHDLKYEHYQ